MRAQQNRAIPPAWGTLECANLVPNRIGTVPFVRLPRCGARLRAVPANGTQRVPGPLFLVMRHIFLTPPATSEA